MRFNLIERVQGTLMKGCILLTGVVGCIDGTHIPIEKPSSEDYEEFRCRKNFFSINVQAVTHHDLRFSNLVARWKGSTHDSRIWNNSSLKAQFESNFVNGYILADNGYACSNYVLTPVLNPSSSAENRYNKSHIATRNTIERLFGVWKSRFQCLRRVLRFRPVKCCHIIIATAVLHNFLKQQNEPDPFQIDDFETSELLSELDEPSMLENVVNTRQYVIQTFFS